MRLGGVVCDQNDMIIVVVAELVCSGGVGSHWIKCCADGAVDHRATCYIQHPHPAISITDPNLVAVGDQDSVGARAVVGRWPGGAIHRTDETRHKLIY